MRAELRELPAEALAELVTTPETIHQALAATSAAGVSEPLDLGDTWHGLHYLLCGDPWGGPPPLGFLMNGGEPIGEEDLGHGPARGFAPLEVRAIAVALGGIAWEGLWDRWRPDAIRQAGLYQVDPDAPELEAARLRAAFEKTRAYVTGLAERERAMLVCLR